MKLTLESEIARRMSILICTPDSTSNRFRQCYNAVLETTRDFTYDLRIFDNRGSVNFSHIREINKAIDIADGPLITIDDDVIVSGNWLGAMLNQLVPSVGIISCTSTNERGQIRSKGATFRKDGVAVLLKREINDPIYVPCVGSCCSLINVSVLNGLRYSTEYQKYCFDPDLSFRLWEKGLSTVVIPEKVFHDSGGTMRDLNIDRKPFMRADEEVLRKKWIETYRLQEIYDRHSHLWPEELRRIYES